MPAKFTIFIYPILIFNSISLSGQIQRNTGQMVGAAYSGSAIEAFDLYQKGDSEDTYYLNEAWLFGSIDFPNNSKYKLNNVPIKFDIVNNRLEVKLKGEVKIVDLKMVSTLRLFDPSLEQEIIFKNGITVNGSKNSIYKLLTKGDHYSFFKKYYFLKLQADYNPQFDTGSKTETIQIKEQYYVYSEVTKQLEKIGFGTSQLKKFFRGNERVSQIIKTEKLKVKKESDLVQAFNLINNNLK